MELLIENTLSLENPNFMDACIKTFMAKVSTMKLRDSKEMGEENEISWGQSHYENFNYSSHLYSFDFQ